MRRLLMMVLLLILASSFLEAQSDNILWGSIKLQKTINPKWGLAIQPFLRLDDDFGGYQNTSLDYSIRHNVSNSWYVQLLGRTWFVPDNADRQFLWLDVAYKKSYTEIPLTWTNRIRWHYALDINNRTDVDFFRYLTQLRLRSLGKFQPIFGVELWWQTQLINDLTVYRIEPGFRYDLNSKSNVLLLWRRQNVVNREISGGDNLWVLVLTFDL